MNEGNAFFAYLFFLVEVKLESFATHVQEITRAPEFKVESATSRKDMENDFVTLNDEGKQASWSVNSFKPILIGPDIRTYAPDIRTMQWKPTHVYFERGCIR